jgi:hypothetical protein
MAGSPAPSEDTCTEWTRPQAIAPRTSAATAAITQKTGPAAECTPSGATTAMTANSTANPPSVAANRRRRAGGTAASEEVTAAILGSGQFADPPD